MRQVLDCLYRLHHHHTRIEQVENKLLECEQFMEQSLVNKGRCEITSYDRNGNKQIHR